MVKNLPAVQETQVWSLGCEDPLEKEMTAHSSNLAGEPHGQRSLVGYSPWGHKELDRIEQLTVSVSDIFKDILKQWTFLYLNFDFFLY